MTNSEQIIQANLELAAELLGWEKHPNGYWWKGSISTWHVAEHLCKQYLTLETVNAVVARECGDDYSRDGCWARYIDYLDGYDFDDPYKAITRVDQATAEDKLAALVLMKEVKDD